VLADPVLADPVLCRQGNALASSFHPELTSDRRLHRLFSEMAGVLQPASGRVGPRRAASGR